MSREKTIWQAIDWWAMGIYALMLTVGWFNIYSSEFSDTQKTLIDFKLSHGKQLMWIGISMLLGFVILMMDVRIYHTLSYVIYAAMLALVIITIFVGKEVNGARGWLQIGGFQLQSAEFMKVATAMALARFLSNYGVDMKLRKDWLTAFAIILIPAVLILLQNDTGSALVFFALTIVLFREGLHPLFLIIPVSIAVESLMVLIFGKIPVLISVTILSALAYYFMRYVRRFFLFLLPIYFALAGLIFGVDFAYNKVLKDYQRDRIDIIIGKKDDPRGAGYNLRQSLIAIGSGGIIGKGYLKGTQTKFNFVPEQTTDFIFCTVGEEWGLLGSTVVIVLFMLLLGRIIMIAERQKFIFNRYYSYGVLSIIFIHFLINISMTLGLFPVIGIPLPFISYGGSAMIGFSILFFIMIKLDAANNNSY